MVICIRYEYGISHTLPVTALIPDYLNGLGSFICIAELLSWAFQRHCIKKHTLGVGY